MENTTTSDGNVRRGRQGWAQAVSRSSPETHPKLVDPESRSGCSKDSRSTPLAVRGIETFVDTDYAVSGVYPLRQILRPEVHDVFLTLGGKLTFGVLITACSGYMGLKYPAKFPERLSQFRSDDSLAEQSVSILNSALRQVQLEAESFNFLPVGGRKLVRTNLPLLVTIPHYTGKDVQEGYDMVMPYIEKVLRGEMRSSQKEAHPDKTVRDALTSALFWLIEFRGWTTDHHRIELELIPAKNGNHVAAIYQAINQWWDEAMNRIQFSAYDLARTFYFCKNVDLDFWMYDDCVRFWRRFLFSDLSAVDLTTLVDVSPVPPSFDIRKAGFSIKVVFSAYDRGNTELRSDFPVAPSSSTALVAWLTGTGILDANGSHSPEGDLNANYVQYGLEIKRALAHTHRNVFLTFSQFRSYECPHYIVSDMNRSTILTTLFGDLEFDFIGARVCFALVSLVRRLAMAAFRGEVKWKARTVTTLPTPFDVYTELVAEYMIRGDIVTASVLILFLAMTKYLTYDLALPADIASNLRGYLDEHEMEFITDEITWKWLMLPSTLILFMRKPIMSFISGSPVTRLIVTPRVSSMARGRDVSPGVYYFDGQEFSSYSHELSYQESERYNITPLGQAINVLLAQMPPASDVDHYRSLPTRYLRVVGDKHPFFSVIDKS